MLRKRATFKPNLKQVGPSQPVNGTQAGLAKDGPSSQEKVVDTNNQIDTGYDPVIEGTLSEPNRSDDRLSSTNQTPKSPIKEVGNVTGNSSKYYVQELTAVSNQRVQEAITQLTGQKFEPIKSLSLRCSVNKNVKLKDLLFFNPPMTKDQRRHKKSIFLAKKSEQKKSQADEQAKTASSKQKPDKESGSEEQSLVPKVKMGPEGRLVLDESSTIINRKNSIMEQEAIIEDNEDVVSKTNYDSFRRRPTNTSQTKWSTDETQKFYHALSILGTDFSMMESLLFSGLRSRTELHKKFKREERVNKPKIDIALSNRISLNSEELDDLKEIL